MRRTYWLLTALMVSMTAVALWLRPGRVPAKPVASETCAPPAAQAAPVLPLSRVVLFSSGVGYFQREGTVEGDARVDLSFRVNDINDLLKSMVLQDLDGGQVSAVNFDSNDPPEKALKSFAIDLTENPSIANMLLQARGERIELTIRQRAGEQASTLAGTIVGTETQKPTVSKENADPASAAEMQLLTVWTADGMRSVRLHDVQLVRFLNPAVETEFKRALTTLARSHDTRKKLVSLQFTGHGKRKVRVGYVVEHPIWKTSYRLVLSDAGHPYLQGWAVVENPSDDDWTDVRMALVSGRPISFRMDLYAPLYVNRPVVEPELFASLRPPSYNGGSITFTNAQGGIVPPGAQLRNLANPTQNPGGLFANNMGAGAAPNFDIMNNRSLGLGVRSKQALRLNDAEPESPLVIREGVPSAASATHLGDHFQYAINHPVTLPRQKSALLPIVDKDIEGKPVSIYNESVHAKYPMLGLRLKNASGLHLMEGPITVFEGDVYAGDARISDLQPNEERLLSYAVDLGTEVDPVRKEQPDTLVSVRLRKGILETKTQRRQAVAYRIKNRSDRERTVVIEHPVNAAFHLVAREKPIERARDVYRFEQKVPPLASAEEVVMEEQTVAQTVALLSASDEDVAVYLRSGVVSEDVKKAVRQAGALKGKLEATRADLARLAEQIRGIGGDQERLRANLKEMPPTAAAYKRYLDKFDAQETEIDKLQARQKQLQAEEDQQARAYAVFVANLDVQ